VREPLPLSAGAMQRTGNDNEQGAQRGGRGHGVGHAGKVQRRVRSERARAHAARAAQQRGRGQQRRRVQQDGRARRVGCAGRRRRCPTPGAAPVVAGIMHTRHIYKVY